MVFTTKILNRKGQSIIKIPQTLVKKMKLTVGDKYIVKQTPLKKLVITFFLVKNHIIRNSTVNS